MVDCKLHRNIFNYKGTKLWDAHALFKSFNVSVQNW